MLVPFFLVLMWLVHEAHPYFHYIDMQVFKESLKPLVLTPFLTVAGFASWFVASLVAMHLGAEMGRGRLPWPLAWALALLPLAAVGAAKVTAIGAALTLDLVAGMATAVAVWTVGAWWAGARARAGALALLLLAYLVADGLSPLAAGGDDAFLAALGGGDRLAMAAALAGKVFLYGSLAWLLLTAVRGKAAPMRPLAMLGALAASVAVPAVVLVAAHQAGFAPSVGRLQARIVGMSADAREQACRAYGLRGAEEIRACRTGDARAVIRAYDLAKREFAASCAFRAPAAGFDPESCECLFAAIHEARTRVEAAAAIDRFLADPALSLPAAFGPALGAVRAGGCAG